MSKLQSPKIEIGWGTVGQARAEGLDDLIVQHYEEVESEDSRRIAALDVNWPLILMLERTGVYKVILAHVNGKLAGYAAYYLQPPIDYKGSLWAMNHVLFVDRSFRTVAHGRLGPQLLQAAEDLFRKMGAKLILQEDRKAHSTQGKVRATLGRLLTRIGYKPVGTLFAKEL